jgi:putative membrane protein
MKFLINTLITAVSILITSYIISGIQVANFTTAVIAALVLGIVNFFIRPLMLLVTLPVNIMTLGLFTFVVNALMLALAAAVVDGFSISGPLAAIVGSLIISVVSTVLSTILNTKK